MSIKKYLLPGVILLLTLIMGLAAFASAAPAPVPEPAPMPAPAPDDGLTYEEVMAKAIDPQSWKLARDMTWDDWTPNPLIDWVNEDEVPDARVTLRGALILVDFPDRKFLVTNEQGSQLLGNPTVPRVATDDLAKFWRDYLMESSAENHGVTINSYWKENTYGMQDISLEAYGPYTMPRFEFQYGGTGITDVQNFRDVFPRGTGGTGQNASSITGNGLARVAYEYAKEEGVEFFDEDGEPLYDFLFFIHAGYDPSGLWQEIGEMTFLSPAEIEYEFSGLARLESIQEMINDEDFDLITDWPNFFLFTKPTSNADKDNYYNSYKKVLYADAYAEYYEDEFDAAYMSYYDEEFEDAYDAYYDAELDAAYEKYLEVTTDSPKKTKAEFELTFTDFLDEQEFEDEVFEPDFAAIFEADFEENFRAAFDAILDDTDPELYKAIVPDILQGHLARAIEAAQDPEIGNVSTVGGTNFIHENANMKWAGSRYIPWSAWLSSMNFWTTEDWLWETNIPGKAGESFLWDISTQAESDGMATFAHEFGHIRGLCDNYNAPFTLPMVRSYTGPWDLMSRGSFNGPGGNHQRYQAPANMAGSSPPNQMLYGKIRNHFTAATDIADVSVEELKTKGPVIAEIVARNIPTNTSAIDYGVDDVYRGIRVTGFIDETPKDNNTMDPLNNTGGNLVNFPDALNSKIDPNKWNWGTYRNNLIHEAYTVEVVERTGYDSFCLDSGVLLTKTVRFEEWIGPGLANAAEINGQANLWIIDAHPGALGMPDFYRPDGTLAGMTDGDQLQLAGALFHAGVHNDPNYGDTFTGNGMYGPLFIGSEYEALDEPIVTKAAGNTVNEWADEYNDLHFYIVNKHNNEGLVDDPKNPGAKLTYLSYDVAVRSSATDAHKVGGSLELEAGAFEGADEGLYAVQKFTLKHSSDADMEDIIRIVLFGDLAEDVILLNNLYALAPGEDVEFEVYIKAGAGGLAEFPEDDLIVAAKSETNPAKLFNVQIGDDSFQANLEIYPDLYDYEKGITAPAWEYDPTNVNNIVEEVYVEVPCDTDGDGKRDLIRLWIRRPIQSAEVGVRIPVLYEQSPYREQTNPLVNHSVNDPLEANPDTTDYTYEDNIVSGKARTSEWYWGDDAKLSATDKVLYGPNGIPAARGPGGTVSENGGTFNGGTWTTTGRYTWYDFFVPRGYAIILGSSIGNKFSEGFTNCGDVEEILCAMATIKWLNGEVKGYTDESCTVEVDATAWCNGNVAMLGQSYNGTIPLGTACSGVEGLKAILPVAGITSWYDYYRENGGVIAANNFQGEDADILAIDCDSRRINLRTTENYDGTHPPYAPETPVPSWLAYYTPPNEPFSALRQKYEEFLDQMRIDQDRVTGDYNSFWDDRNYLSTIDQVNCGIILSHGFNDFNVKPKQMDQFYQGVKAKTDAPIKLMLHRDGHGQIWDMEQAKFFEYAHKWLDHFLYGIDNGIVEEIPELTIANNITGEYEFYDKWPVPGSALTTYYLNPNGEDGAGVFSLTAPATQEKTIKDSLKHRIGTNLSTAAITDWEVDLINFDNLIAPNSERLVFLSDITEDFNGVQGVRFSGTIRLALEAASSKPYGYISAYLVDLGPDTRGFAKTNTTLIPAEKGAGPYQLVDYIIPETLSDYKIICTGHADIQNPNPAKKIYKDSMDTNFIPAYYYQTKAITPGQYEQYYFEFEPNDYTFKQGNQMGLIVFTTDYRNTPTPEDPPEITIKFGPNTYVEIPSIGVFNDIEPKTIEITTQPAANTSFTAGSISGSLTVEASVAPDETLTYQWYSNTAKNNTDGTAVTGATSANFAIPTDLINGTYYFYCVVSALGAAPEHSNVATVTVGGGGTGGGSSGGGSSNASISPVRADYESDGGKDISVTLTRNGRTLKALTNGSYTLKEGTDYTISSNTVTIKASYLDTLDAGAQTIVFEMSSGTSPRLTITVKGAAEVEEQEEEETGSAYKPMAPLHDAGTKVEATKTNNVLILDEDEMDFPAVKIGGYNWIKLRDFAMLLNGSKKQFSVTYDEATNIIDIRTAGSYQPLGDELEDKLADTESAIASPQRLRVNGEFIDTAAYNIKGYNYFRVRDLAIILNFAVIYDDTLASITLDLDNPYIED